MSKLCIEGLSFLKTLQHNIAPQRGERPYRRPPGSFARGTVVSLASPGVGLSWVPARTAHARDLLPESPLERLGGKSQLGRACEGSRVGWEPCVASILGDRGSLPNYCIVCPISDISSAQRLSRVIPLNRRRIAPVAIWLGLVP